LAVYNTNRVSNLIGKGLSCRERICRIEAGLTRFCIKIYEINIIKNDIILVILIKKEKLLLVRRDIC
jgi:hypothetical protein